MPRKMGVLLDTNILMLIGRGIDIFTQIEELLDTKPEYYVIEPVVKELEKIIAHGGVKERKAAKLALELVKKKCRIIEISLSPDKSVDDLLLEIALREGFIVATNDRELRRRLREAGILEIYFREEKQLLEAQGVY
ncbi:MAG: 30S processome protein Utp24 [Thermoprotei archaeon]|nr:MAG: 30S processome protein Utp24 [Thermoprotei archaeon]